MRDRSLHFVYGLTDPRFTDEAAIRYIGVTLNPNQRYASHLQCGPLEPIQKNAWIQDLRREGLEPGIEIFETFLASKKDSKLISEREAYWIRYYQSTETDLLNIQKINVPYDKEDRVKHQLKFDDIFSLLVGDSYGIGEW